MGLHLQEAYILVEKTAQKQPNLKRWHKEKTITLWCMYKTQEPQRWRQPEEDEPEEAHSSQGEVLARSQDVRSQARGGGGVGEG